MVPYFVDRSFALDHGPKAPASRACLPFRERRTSTTEDTSVSQARVEVGKLETKDTSAIQERVEVDRDEHSAGRTGDGCWVGSITRFGSLFLKSLLRGDIVF